MIIAIAIGATVAGTIIVGVSAGAAIHVIRRRAKIVQSSEPVEQQSSEDHKMNMKID